MALRFLGTPKVQYFDTRTNTFLNAGKLYAFVVGSSTPTNTYPTIADAIAETNANANPVVLDSRGEADVVLKGATKLVLKDASDNLVWTVDNIIESSAIYGALNHIVLDFSDVASAINYAKITNSATGNPVKYGVAGTDTNIAVAVEGKGTGATKLGQATSIGVQLVADQPLLDSAGNELFKFTATASAVNEITYANAATGNNPSYTPSGGDTNIGENHTMKGSGTFNLRGNSTQAGRLRSYENTANGTNYASIGAAESLASDLDFTLPSSYAALANQVMVGSGAGSLSFGTLLGTPATATEMEAGTSVTAAVTPGVQQRHPSAAKAWCQTTYNSGTPVASTSYNVSSITDTGTGTATINLTVSFSGGNYAAVANVIATNTYPARLQSKIAGSYVISTVDNSLVLADLPSDSCAYGDQ